MTSAELENLVRLGQLKREPPVALEIGGLLHSGEARLTDAANRALSLESRFDLAYDGPTQWRSPPCGCVAIAPRTGSCR